MQVILRSNEIFWVRGIYKKLCTCHACKIFLRLIHNTCVQSSFQFCSPDKLYHRGRVFTHRRPAILQPGRDQVGSHQSAAQVRQRRLLHGVRTLTLDRGQNNLTTDLAFGLAAVAKYWINDTAFSQVSFEFIFEKYCRTVSESIIQIRIVRRNITRQETY